MIRRVFNSTIVNQPQAITVDWIDRLLQSQPELASAGTKISGVEIYDVDVGTTTRIRLSVTHNSAGKLPSRWFVKLPSLSWQARAITALPRLLPTEVRFYNELADKIPLRIPKKIFASSRLGFGSTLVIEDVTELGARPGKTGEALTAAEAGSVVEELALFHSAFMVDTHQHDSLSWLAGPVRRLEDFLGTALAVPLMKRGIKLAYDSIPTHLHRQAIDYAKNRKAVMEYLSDAPPTLLHHDCHPGNLFWLDGRPGFLDWQMVRFGEGVSDISYFMATALEPETRRACESELLEKYLRIMCKNSRFNYDLAKLQERYRAHLVYPFEAMVVTLAVGGLMELKSNLTMIRRAAQAVSDHGSFSLLDLNHLPG